MALTVIVLSISLCEAKPTLTTEVAEANMDCSYAIVDGICYAPLDTCITLSDNQSEKVYCVPMFETVHKSEWISNPLCQGTANHTTTLDTNLQKCHSNCDTTRKTIIYVPPLLPPATESTSAPTLSTMPPTLYTSAPTQSPLQCVATANGKSIFPTRAPMQLTKTPTIAPTDDMKSGANTNNAVFTSPSIPMHALCLLINIILFISLVYHLLIKSNKKNKTQIVWSVKLFVLFTFISNIVGTLCLLILSTIMATNKWTQDTRQLAVMPYYGVAVAYCSGKFTLECFYLFRVYIAFRKSTVYALSKWLCVALMCFMLTVSLVSCYMFLMDPNRFNMPYYGYILISCLETLLIVVLLYMFLKRLLMLILRHKLGATNDRKASTNTSSTRPTSSSTTETSETVSNLSAKQMKWIFLITRCILLSSISLISTILFGFFAYYFCQYRNTDLFIVYGLWSLDMATNTVCLYLNFIFANTLYNKSCSFCHNLCQRMVEFVAKRLFKVPLNDVKNLEMEQN